MEFPTSTTPFESRVSGLVSCCLHRSYVSLPVPYVPHIPYLPYIAYEPYIACTTPYPVHPMYPISCLNIYIYILNMYVNMYIPYAPYVACIPPYTLPCHTSYPLCSTDSPPPVLVGSRKHAAQPAVAKPAEIQRRNLGQGRVEGVQRNMGHIHSVYGVENM